MRKIKMAKNKNVEISLEEKLRQALVPVDEQPYTIPSNWVWVGLKYISKKIFAGGDKPENFSKMKTDKNIFPIFSNGIDKDGLYGYTDEAKVLEKALTISARGTIGFTKIREANFTPIIRLIVIILKDRILYEFLDYYFKYNSLEGVGSSIPQLTVPIVNEKIIPLSPLEEQKRIVEKLDFLFEKTKKAKEIIEEIKIDIENRKISILDRAFKGTLTSKWRNENKTSDVKELLKSINEEKIKKWEKDCLQAEKDGNKKPKKPIIKEVKDMIVPVDKQPYKLPDSWVWVRLGEISKLSGGSGFPEKYQGFLDKNIPFYKVGSLKNIDDNFYIENSENYIDDDILTEIKAKLFPANTIIFAKIGEAIRLNRRAILKENSCIDNNLMALVSNSSCYFRYVYFWLKKEDLYKYAQATTVPSIRQSTLEELEFPLPPLEEQEEIVRALDEVLENENKVKELLEKSILHKAFKGELGTQNSSDEPALNLLKSIL
ncbi:type I restriction modification DNA specificity domain protein [Fusobacterium periodonticum ATCC 33693]|uniref:Type I restriction modification DNA specificity domain protein n=2 Tax=Fusobacterium periodonticum TaxID=860 RepID=D4CTF2_9FUSO|nr:type I restriction modification DNA specificity domain protein [Fusobacterium periodonticum ATCC 33693]